MLTVRLIYLSRVSNFKNTISYKSLNPFSVYPGTVSGSTTRSHSVYPVTVTLLQPVITSTRWYRYI